MVQMNSHLILHVIISALQWVFLVPAVVGCVYSLMCMAAVVRYRLLARRPAGRSFDVWPPVTVLKPIHGLDKNLAENIRSTCRQDYPDFQVVLSVQRLDDPAIPLLYEVQREFGEARVTVAVENVRLGTNGKINNLAGGLRHARHEILVISDSDVVLRTDYLKTIVAPLADPGVGYVCTLYKMAGADKWYEKLELLSLNADLMTNIVFAYVTGASKFCLGASTALRRSTLDAIGGLQALADYLVEDNEMGDRIRDLGLKMAVVPYMVDNIVDLSGFSQWWGHQVYWDQNNRATRPVAYFLAAVAVRPFPFACLLAVARLADPLSLSLLCVTFLIRLASAFFILGWGFRDREGVRALGWLPLRDLAALASWALSYFRTTVVWRGSQFVLTRDGRLLSREVGP
jgi:ceramide glucosyltransferase